MEHENDNLVRPYSADIDRKAEAISKIVKTLTFCRKGFGSPYRGVCEHYTGLVNFGEFAMTLCTDGVGTKIMVAESMNKWDTIGIDCIAMNVNDTICIGAQPIAFVDYIAVDSPNDAIIKNIGIGLNEGAKQANVTVVGGETAILPELVNGIDLSGTALGYVRKNEIISGSSIRGGDLLVGLASTGIHSNGFTLARSIFKERGYGYEDRAFGTVKLGVALLEPTQIYVHMVLDLLRKYRCSVTGMAHITGGGLRNLLRLQQGMEFRITNPMKPPEIFRVMKELGSIDETEMYQVFNMGMGFCISVREKNASEILKAMRKHCNAQIVGEVVKIKGKSRVNIPQKEIVFTKY